MKNIFALIVLAALITSCSKEETSKIKNVDLSSLEEGQKSYYYRYTTSCDNMEDDFEFTGDTLILEVVKVEEELYMKEYVTPNSPLYLDGSWTEEISYSVKNAGSGLIMPDHWNSALFFFYSNDTLRLGMNHDVNLIQDGCKMLLEDEPFIGNDIGNISHFKVGPVQYNDLTAVSCEPLENLDAYLIHDENRLYGSHVILFDWGNVGKEVVSGWKLDD